MDKVVKNFGKKNMEISFKKKLKTEKKKEEKSQELLD